MFNFKSKKTEMKNNTNSEGTKKILKYLENFIQGRLLTADQQLCVDFFKSFIIKEGIDCIYVTYDNYDFGNKSHKIFSIYYTCQHNHLIKVRKPPELKNKNDKNLTNQYLLDNYIRINGNKLTPDSVFIKNFDFINEMSEYLYTQYERFYNAKSDDFYLNKYLDK